MVDPVLPDIVRFLRLADSKVADVFAEFLSAIGGAALPVVAKALGRENCWLRQRVLCTILPHWSDASLAKLRDVLALIATQPDAYDNDVRCVEFLAQRGLADISWLQDWLKFKRARWKEREQFLRSAEAAISKARTLR